MGELIIKKIKEKVLLQKPLVRKRRLSLTSCWLLGENLADNGQEFVQIPK